jgi:alpha-ketoglutarate-dependent taurine dioxygenase
VLLRGLRDACHFSETLSTLGNVYRHPHSRSDGLTHLVSESDDFELLQAAETNRLGMTESALTPHTDRSGMDDPPRLLGFWIESQSSVGGASTFVDGHRLIEDLSTHEPDSIRILTRPKSVIFRSEDGLREGEIVELSGEKLRLRFRFDRMVYFAPDVAELIPRLNDLIREQAKLVRLRAGEGYLVDNHRWLHGRTHFSGRRSCYRILLRSEELGTK